MDLKKLHVNGVRELLMDFGFEKVELEEKVRIVFEHPSPSSSTSEFSSKFPILTFKENEKLKVTWPI